MAYVLRANTHKKAVASCVLCITVLLVILILWIVTNSKQLQIILL